MQDTISQCKEVLPLPALWHKLGVPGEPKRSCKSPFRDDDDRSSFSVFERDGRWYFKDHAREEDKGDEIDFIERWRKCDNKEAIRIYHDLAGVTRGGKDSSRASAPPRKPVNPAPATQAAPARPKRSDFKPDWTKLGQVAKIYDYLDADGAVLHQTFRFDPKDFRQRRRPVAAETPADDGWVYFLEGIETVIYRLPEVLGCSATQPIFLLEGEKDADAVMELGLMSTTLPMGAGKWRESYGESLRGKWVVVLGDNDEPGRKHVRKVCTELMGIAGRLGAVFIEEVWPEAPEKGDLSDWIAAQEDGADILVGTLSRWAREAKTPADLLYAPCFGVGPRGGLEVYQDVLAEILVRERQLKFAGESWWRWEETVWRQLEVQRDSRMAIMEAIGSRPQWRNVLSNSLVGSVEELMANRAAMHPDQFNQHDKDLVNCANGMLNVRTRSLAPHEPRYLSTVQVPWSYRPAAVCPLWLAWLEEMLPAQDVRDQMQEIFGYALTTSINYHKFFFFYGDGGTGKSTCVEVLTRLVGEQNTVSIQLQDLDNPFQRAQLVGKRLYLAKELTKDSLKHIGLVKAITSGDPIPVEKKHKDGYSYRPQGRFIMESNVRPTIGDTSEGFFRRLCQVTFSNIIPEERKDYSLLNKLELEMDGIFMWALDGLARLIERGRFVETVDSADASALIAKHRASVKAFVETCTVDVEDQRQLIAGEELFEEYKEWCAWEHVRPYYEDTESFCREMMNRFPALRERRRRVRDAVGNRQVRYSGLALREWRGEAEG
jgi:putative DNA primase/helicase